MVWGAISYERGVGPLARVNGTLDGEEYLHIVRYRLKKYHPGLYGGGLIYQEGNARPHKCHLVQDWFDEKDIEVMDG